MIICTKCTCSFASYVIYSWPSAKVPLTHRLCLSLREDNKLCILKSNCHLVPPNFSQ